MEKLTGTEGKELIMPLVLPYFESIGFVCKKSKNKDINLFRKTSSGTDYIYITSNNYSPLIYFQFGLFKIIESVEKYSDMVKANLGLENLGKETIFICPTAPDNLRHMDMPACTNELHVKESAEIIIDKCKNNFIPLFDKFNDINELDKYINGNDKWWGDRGWDISKILDFPRFGFYYKRFIIAKLAGRQNIQELYDFSKLNYENHAKNDGWPEEDSIYDNGWFEVVMNVLKDVEPL